MKRNLEAMRTMLAIVLVSMLTLSFRTTLADDNIAKTLDLAEERYESDLAEIDTLVLKWFDEQETRVRKTGKKEAVDKVLAERDAFSKNGEISESIPVSIVRKRTHAEQRLVFAFERAVSEYIKRKEDILASKTQDELKALRETPRPTDDRKVWKHPKGQFKVLENGEWEEESGNGKIYRYKEVSRNKEFVELDALNGDTKTRYRIFTDRIDYGRKPGLTFTTMFKGSWSSLSGRTK
jgi:hypothetical protein